MKKLFVIILFVTALILVSRSYSPARGDVKMLIDSIIDLDFMAGPEDDFHGMASYYGDEFVGRKTSSGEIFYQDKMTAAHKKLPFGTIVKVTNLSNGQEVTVMINDRGPFKTGRIIDLTKSAAIQLDMINDGTTEVKLEIVR
ncbi:septal ring lytic transglycosylase RlpA family protein [Bacteroidota bacterium]